MSAAYPKGIAAQASRMAAGHRRAMGGVSRPGGIAEQKKDVRIARLPGQDVQIARPSPTTGYGTENKEAGRATTASHD